MSRRSKKQSINSSLWLALLVILIAIIVVFMTILGSQPERRRAAAQFSLQPPQSAEPFFPDQLTDGSRPHAALQFEHEYGRAWWSVMTSGRRRFHQEMRTATFDGEGFGEPQAVPVNGDFSCGGPIPRDGSTLLYVNLNAPGEGGEPVMTLWEFELDGTQLVAGKRLEIPMVGGYIGSQFTFGPEEGSLIVIMRPPGESNGLYMTTRLEEGTYTTPELLPPAVCTDAMEADPCYDPVSKTLIFAAERSEGYGRLDLYASRYLGDGQWSEAVHLGDAVNTPGFERFPSVTPDGSALIFTREWMTGEEMHSGYYWISMETVLRTLPE